VRTQFLQAVDHIGWSISGFEDLSRFEAIYEFVFLAWIDKLKFTLWVMQV
jgi:hypothetical protein